MHDYETCGHLMKQHTFLKYSNFEQSNQMILGIEDK